MPGSEVAQLKQQIDTEQIAATRGLSGLAEGTTRHQVITQKIELREHGELRAKAWPVSTKQGTTLN